MNMERKFIPSFVADLDGNDWKKLLKFHEAYFPRIVTILISVRELKVTNVSKNVIQILRFVFR